jgi:predicted NAD/FAD-dependent oxidoreductase
MREIGSAAVIGAGVAGLACAAALAGAGLDVMIYDKGSHPGGRIATRRSGGVTFDHGAQFVAAHHKPFREVLARLSAAGTIRPWIAAMADGATRFSGVPDMSAIGAAMAATAEEAGANFVLNRQVSYLHDTDHGWSLRHLPAKMIAPGAVADAGDAAGPFDVVVLAIPAPQAVPLLRVVGHRFAGAAARAAYAPCLAVMTAFDDRVEGEDVQTPDTGPLAWVARDSGRPGHAAQPDAWVLHATPDWSRANLEKPMASIAPVLLAAFRGLTGAAGDPVHLSTHRWRYARVIQALGEPCLWDAEGGIGLCGDWCLGPRVEAAYESGLALASAALART